MAKRGPKGPMTQEHKEALAQGRNEGHALRRYFDVLGKYEAQSHKRGRRADLNRLRLLVEGATDPMERMKLKAQLREYEAEYAKVPEGELEAAEAGFIKYAKSYGERNKLTWQDWRDEGVPAALLSKAGIGGRVYVKKEPRAKTPKGPKITHKVGGKVLKRQS